MFKKCIYINLRKLQIKFKHTWIQPAGYDTNVKIYNCLIKSKVPLIIKSKNLISWYTCGPTVYDSAHLGHASCYVKFDIIQRILKEYCHMNIVTVMNITDIDDKIIKRSKELSMSAKALAKKYEEEFWSNMRQLNIKKPDIVLRVTENMPIIDKFIRSVLDDKSAYVASDASIYFDLSKFKHQYGKLVPINEQDDKSDEIKKSANDFVLWKNSKANEPSWKVSFGTGRPGWHSECSALASAVFGNQIDIHAGGIDLRFPHHENEEVLSCAYHKVNQWVNYWLHAGYLKLSGHDNKMSKSLNNCVYIKDLLSERKSAGNVFRMACAMSHYRATMEYNQNWMDTAEFQLNKIIEFINNCNDYISRILPPANIDSKLLSETLLITKKEVDQAYRDDFSTAQAIKSITKLINTTNKMIQQPLPNSTPNLEDNVLISLIRNFVIDQYEILGFDKENYLCNSEITDFLNMLIEFRQNIRNNGLQNRNSDILKYCDEVREKMKQLGIEIKDRGKLSSWNKL